jgi:hypothetical protein
MNLKDNTTYSSDVFKLLTKGKTFYSNGETYKTFYSGVETCNILFVELNDIGIFNTYDGHHNDMLFEVDISDNSRISINHNYSNIIYTSNVELVFGKQVCIRELLNISPDVEEIICIFPYMIKYLDTSHPMYIQLCTDVVDNCTKYLTCVQDIELQQKLAMTSYTIFIRLPQENLTEQLLLDFLNNNKPNEDRVATIFLNLKNFISLHVFLKILCVLKKKSIEYLLKNNPHLCVNFEKDIFYEVLIKYYVKLFTYASKFEKLNYKYLKSIHNVLIKGVIPTQCLPDMMQISKMYLSDIDIPYDVQKIILLKKPNYLKYIRNQQDELVIYSVKRYFKLILYVKNINDNIFDEFIKSHGLIKVKKLYNKCEDFKPECAKGSFRCFDLVGFIERYEKLFPKISEPIASEPDTILPNVSLEMQTLIHELDIFEELKLKSKNFRNLVDPSEELCIQAIELDTNNAKYIKNVTLNIYNKIVELDAINIFNSDADVDTDNYLSQIRRRHLK